jgi:hypothetical protein
VPEVRVAAGAAAGRVGGCDVTDTITHRYLGTFRRKEFRAPRKGEYYLGVLTGGIGLAQKDGTLGAWVLEPVAATAPAQDESEVKRA